MNKQDIINYAVETPGNTNKAVLSSMLDQFVTSDNKEEIELSATENNIYTPATGKVYNKVTVNVPVATPSAIEVDFNGGEGPEHVTHVVIPTLYGSTFNADTWWEEMEASVTPPTGKVYQCLATVSTNPTENQIITTIDIASSTYYLYIIWQDE